MLSVIQVAPIVGFDSQKTAMLCDLGQRGTREVLLPQFISSRAIRGKINPFSITRPDGHIVLVLTFRERMHVPAVGIDYEDLGTICGSANKDKPLSIGRPARSANQFTGERRQLEGIVTSRIDGPDVPRTRQRRLECNTGAVRRE